MATAPHAKGRGPQRAWCDPLPTTGSVRLIASEGHHLVRARRVAVGDDVALFDGKGGGRKARVVTAGASGVEVEVLGPADARRPWRSVVVATAWPEGARADDLVAALAELGVESVVPLRTARSQADPTDRVAARAERYTRVAIEAAKVNGHDRCLSVASPAHLLDVLRSSPDRCRVLLDTAPGLASLPSVLAPAVTPNDAVLLLVGPEGGFTDEEVAQAVAAGAVTASLGGLALRTETAAFAAAAVALALGPPVA